MTTYDITSGGAQTVTTSGPVPGTLDVSDFSGQDYTIRIEVQALTAGSIAIIAVEDTANVSPFSDAVQVMVFHFVGQISQSAPIDVSRRKIEIPATRVDVVNGKLRLNVLSLTGSSPSLTVLGTFQQ